MLVLGVESSAKTASCAICEVLDDYQSVKVIASFTANTGNTHSETLMPIIEKVLDISGKTANEIDVLAVSAGPGSFTGVRIGVSTIKGMAYALDKPCVGVSSLKALSLNLIENHGIICAVMDARREQVYNALFRVDGYQFERICDDRAISIEELKAEIDNFNEKVFLVGDGADLVNKTINGNNIILANPLQKQQSGISVCMAVLGEEKVDSNALMPVYLRLAQAQRERNERLKNE